MSIREKRNDYLKLVSAGSLKYNSKNSHSMIHNPLIIRLKKRGRPLIGMEGIKNRHKLIDLVENYLNHNKTSIY